MASCRLKKVDSKLFCICCTFLMYGRIKVVRDRCFIMPDRSVQLHARVKTWHKYKARTSTGDDDIPDVCGERLDDGGGGVAVVHPAR